MITAETLVDQLDDEIQMTYRAIDRFGVCARRIALPADTPGRGNSEKRGAGCPFVPREPHEGHASDVPIRGHESQRPGR